MDHRNLSIFDTVSNLQSSLRNDTVPNAFFKANITAPTGEANITAPESNSTLTDLIVKYYVTNPIVLQKISQQPTNDLIPLNTMDFCRQVGDQACIASNSNFKMLLIQTSKDPLGNWILNGEAQNIATHPLKNVRIVWSLYDSHGNIVGLVQGSLVPSNQGIGQTALFNLKSSELIDVPKFYRVSFE
ncbi:MAG: hypothetical protein ACTHL3_07725 [Candidatus Nitrosocosmicus sp.]